MHFHDGTKSVMIDEGQLALVDNCVQQWPYFRLLK
jgi:hypothetical protein